MTAVLTPVQGPPSPESTSTDHAECGKCASTACTKALHVIGVVQAPDKATGDQLGKAVIALGQGLLARWWQPSSIAEALGLVIAAWLAGDECCVAVGCDGNAVPQPPTANNQRHWIAPFSNESAVWSYFQCWDNTYQHLVNLGAVIALDVINPIVAIGRTGVNALIQTEDDMFTDADRANLALVTAAVQEREVSGEIASIEFNGQKHDFHVRNDKQMNHKWWDGSHWNEEELKLVDSTGATANLVPGSIVTLEKGRGDGLLHVEVEDAASLPWHWWVGTGNWQGPDHN